MENQDERVLKYSKLVEDLKNKIFSGELKAKDRLPSENELSAAYEVSRQTVRKALSVLGQEGYIYAEHGRGTFCSERVRHTKKSGNIAVVTTYLSDYIFPRVIQGIDQVMTNAGYSILLKNTRNSRKMEARCLEELLQKDIDGLIIEPSKSQIFCAHMHLYEKLDEFEIPYVFIQGSFKQMGDKPQILMDDYAGGYQITEYLTSLGHKKIAGVFKADDMQGLNRHNGYAAALQKSGLTYDPSLVVWFYTEDRTIHPYESILQMVSEMSDIDAVVCYNDQIALEVIRALSHIGKKVPKDISVTGYDNSVIAQAEGVSLTTIAHPQEKLGEMAAQMLLSLMKNKEKQDLEEKIVIPPELIIRNSCKKRDTSE